MSDYTPKSLDTSGVKLTKDQAELVEALAENVHEVWAETRTAQGWRWGEQRDDVQMLHPNLVPYQALSEDDKDVDRIMVREVVKAALMLGYKITKPKKRRPTAEKEGD